MKKDRHEVYGCSDTFLISENEKPIRWEAIQFGGEPVGCREFYEGGRVIERIDGEMSRYFVPAQIKPTQLSEENRKLRETLHKYREALYACDEYFDNRADAEYFTDSPNPVGNTEMYLLGIVRDALGEGV